MDFSEMLGWLFLIHESSSSSLLEPATNRMSHLRLVASWGTPRKMNHVGGVGLFRSLRQPGLVLAWPLSR